MVILKKKVPGVSPSRLERFVRRARKAVGVRGSANILVTHSRELRSLNARFRGKDKPTDVLSFPSVPGLPGKLAGDLAISADIAISNARLLGHSPEDEILILILHGLLHLAGHDHERDNGEMERKEVRLRRILGLPVSLIERTKASSRSPRC